IAVPRYGIPPEIEQPPLPCGYVNTGGVVRPVSATSVLKRFVPSNALQPKSWAHPAGRSAVGPTTLISSNWFWPTSGIHNSPVTGSNAIFHGFRSPHANTSGAPSMVVPSPRTSGPPANGLSGGIEYGRSPDGVGSMRSSEPRSDVGSCATRSGSPPEPPSPSVTYRRPSASTERSPALWLLYGCSTVSRTRSDDVSNVPSAST